MPPPYEMQNHSRVFPVSHPVPVSCRRQGRGQEDAFTLLEVLAALGVCVLLACVAATASMQSSRAIRRAGLLHNQTLRLRSLYAQARLHPSGDAEDGPYSAADAWHVDRDERFVPAHSPRSVASRLDERPPVPPRRWSLLTLRDATGTLRPVQLAVLETEEP